MFGFVRFVLAWVVAFSHLTQTFKYSSALSVYAFYMLSGFFNDAHHA